MGFNTYYWKGCVLGDPALERAREALASGGPSAARIDAFETLLRSGETTAVGIALDHYAYGESSSRHGGGDPFAPYAGEVLERARDLLREAPLPASESGAKEDGADHASALGAMSNLAGAEDIELITRALERATTLNVRCMGAMVAERALEQSTEPSDRLIDVLARILTDESSDREEREAALRALGAARSRRAIDLVVQCARQSDLRLQVRAALGLAVHHLDSHRALLEEIVASWPEDPPYPASDVLDILEQDGDEA